MVSFSFKKKFEPKPVVVEIEPDDNAPRTRVLTDFSQIVNAQPVQQTKADELVIPCHTIVNTEPKPVSTRPAKINIKGGAGGFVYLPGESIGTKRKGTSLLMSIRAARQRGEVNDAPDQPKRAYEPEDFAWGVLRGMGYDPANDKSSPPADLPVKSNREKYGIGSNLSK